MPWAQDPSLGRSGLTFAGTFGPGGWAHLDPQRTGPQQRLGVARLTFELARTVAVTRDQGQPCDRRLNQYPLPGATAIPRAHTSGQGNPLPIRPRRPSPSAVAPVVRQGGLALVRLRLRLALLTMAVVPVVTSLAFVAVAFDPASPGTFSLPLAGTLGALALVVVGLAMWMARQVLRPAEELEMSRAHLHQMYEAAREDSLRDGLTGLGNHRAFQEELERQMEWYRRYRVPLSLVVMDLDDLKMINDSQGHAAGDDALRRMGRLVGEAVRYSDRGFRIGGDEFAMLMPHTDSETALNICRRLLERALQSGPGERPVAFSGGVSSCPELTTSRTQLYVQADAALYWCKRHGRSSVDAFDPERDRRVDREATQELGSAVMQVAAASQLRAVFQPIVDLTSGRVLGFEGLIRPTGEAPFPDAGSLFSAAETVGRTVELDAACFNVVATAAQRVPVDQVLSLNLSPRTVEAHDFSVPAVLELLARHSIDPRRLILELTEREAVYDVGRLRANLSDLQKAGIRIAADDVGAGNAGLQLLSQVRFDIVKIDLLLVQQGAQRASSRAVLRSLRDLACRWEAFVVAEGIETSEQLRVVRELGVTAGQGYLLGRPGSSVDLRTVDLAGLEAGHLLMQNAPPAPERTTPLRAVSGQQA